MEGTHSLKILCSVFVYVCVVFIEGVRSDFVDFREFVV